MVPTSSPIIKLTRVPYFHPEYIPPNNLTIIPTNCPNEEPTVVPTIHTVETKYSKQQYTYYPQIDIQIVSNRY